MRWYWWLIIAVLVILLIIIVGWVEFGWFGKELPKDEKLKEELKKAKKNVSFPLRVGSAGNAVMAIQRYLNSNNSKFDCPKVDRELPEYLNKRTNKSEKVWPVEEDGIFGSQVLQALRVCYNTEVITEAQYDNLISKL